MIKRIKGPSRLPPHSRVFVGSAYILTKMSHFSGFLKGVGYPKMRIVIVCSSSCFKPYDVLSSVCLLLFYMQLQQIWSFQALKRMQKHHRSGSYESCAIFLNCHSLKIFMKEMYDSRMNRSFESKLFIHWFSSQNPIVLIDSFTNCTDLKR